MKREMAERFQRWFDHERHAHAKVIVSLTSVPAEQRSAPAFRKAVDLLAHIAGARWVWLVRLGIVDGSPGSLFAQASRLRGGSGTAEACA